MAVKCELPEGFEATPLGMALIADANNGKEFNIDDVIDCVVEYGQLHQQAFEFHEQADFLHEHPAFMSIPATRVVGRSPTFTEVFEKLSGTEEELTHFRNKIVVELVVRGDMRPSAEEVVKEAIALASAIASKDLSYGAELMALAGFDEVPTTSAVIAAIMETTV